MLYNGNTMKERETTTITVRIDYDLLDRVNENYPKSRQLSPKDKKPSRNAWIIWAIKNGLRKHSKNGGQQTK